jgi:hypothetical protein
MITEFCMNCGAKIEYALNKPNFCSSCGSSLGGVAKAAQPQETNIVTEVTNEEPSDTIPNISKLEYSIETNQNKLTFGDLMTQASQDSKNEYKRESVRPKANINTSEDILKSTMNQCRSSKEPEDIGG